jgi:peroxiredoxin
MKRDPIILVVVAVVIAGMLFFAVKRAHKNSASIPQDTNMGVAKVGGLAPNFTLQTLDGKKVSLADYRGKAVLVNFWATWCEPCNVEMPWLVDLHKKYAAQGFEILGVAMDDAAPKDIAKFAQDKGVNYPVLIGQDAVGNAYGGVAFLPGNFYVDRNGKIIDKAFGLIGKPEIEENIQKIIASTPEQNSAAGN